MVSVLLVLAGWTWFLLAIPFVILALVTHYDDDDNFSGSPVPFLIVVATFAFITAFTDLNLFAAVWNNLITVALYAVGYFIAGTVYAFPKWASYYRHKGDRYEEQRDSIKDRYAAWAKRRTEAGEVPLTFQQWVLAEYNFPPRAGNNKARIYYWITYWPASLVFTIFNDPLRRIFNAIYTGIGATFDRMAANSFKGRFEEFGDK